jgi:DNA recombination-dependent growth factor C
MANWNGYILIDTASLHHSSRSLEREEKLIIHTLKDEYDMAIKYFFLNWVKFKTCDEQLTVKSPSQLKTNSL